MSISLKIVSYHRLSPGQQDVFKTELDAFTIGRNDENDWAIPDPQRFLSGVHCRIHRQGGEYFLTDTSTNGVFLNGADTRLERNATVSLGHQDQFRIGDYEFEVLIDGDSAAEENDDTDVFDESPFDDDATFVGQTQTDNAFENDEDEFDDEFDDPFSDSAAVRAPSSKNDGDFEKDINTPLEHYDNAPMAANAVSIESLLDLDDLDEDESEQVSAESLRERHNPLNDSFKPSNRIESGAEKKDSIEFEDNFSTEIPDNWDEATGMQKIPDDASAPEAKEPPRPKPVAPDEPAMTETQSPEPATPEAANPEPARPEKAPPEPATPGSTVQSGEALAAFMKGAGLESGDLAGIDEKVLFEQIGSILAEFTDGLVQTLSGRTHIKSEFRLDQTMIRPVENNPLKFSTSRSSTLKQLLNQKDTAYTSGAKAVKEGFEDVNAHQMAVVAGMEAALQDILKRFNPDALEKRLESDSFLDNIMPGGKKAKYWEMFKLLFDQIAGEAEDDFQQLFGSKFSRAYEQQLDRLKNNH